MQTYQLRESVSALTTTVIECYREKRKEKTNYIVWSTFVLAMVESKVASMRHARRRPSTYYINEWTM
jgi:hypothetical protein